MPFHKKYLKQCARYVILDIKKGKAIEAALFQIICFYLIRGKPSLPAIVAAISFSLFNLVKQIYIYKSYISFII